MAIVQVKASKEYAVIIQPGMLEQVGSLAAEQVPGRRAALITEETVNALYGDTVQRSLVEAGFEVYRLVLPAGEATKCMACFGQVLSFLAAHQLTRTDTVFALGGGVIGDLAGFAASVYLRGVSYIQIPTTLLAAVDSSVGGKTAIDLEEGKNLAGAFHQPVAVYCDPKTLSTLPAEVFADGCAEVIKYAILRGEPLLSMLKDRENAPWEEIIAACVSIKRDLVEEDEFDTGVRMFLNLGHTVGHAIEKRSRFGISHGTAVAMGTVIAARLACKMGVCSQETVEEITHLLVSYGLTVENPYPASELLDAMLSDKKRAGDTLRLILPRAIGDCYVYNAPVSTLRELMEGVIDTSL